MKKTQKKPLKKKPTKKKVVKKAITKKKPAKKAVTKKPVKKKVVKKTPTKKPLKKAVAKKALSPKSPPKKGGLLKVGQKALKALSFRKKSPAPQSMALKSPQGEKEKKALKAPLPKTKKPEKSKSQSPSLRHCEQELAKLLEKEKEEKMILKDMKGRTYCVVENCDYPAIVENHCRVHFFGLFEIIKKKKEILAEDLLTKNYETLKERYSPVVLDYLFKDLSSEKNFKMAMKKFEEEEESLESEEAFSD